MDPDNEELFGALGDERCRAIVAALAEEGEGVSATRLSSVLDIPQSTMYRKLDRLVDAALVEKRASLDDEGGHSTRYHVAVENVVVEVDDGMEVTYRTPSGERDDRLE